MNRKIYCCENDHLIVLVRRLNQKVGKHTVNDQGRLFKILFFTILLPFIRAFIKKTRIAQGHDKNAIGVYKKN